MSSKLTELTESSPSALLPSVLCGSGVFSQLSSPSMASSGQFDRSQTSDGYRAVEVLDPACSECLAKVTCSRQRDVARWTSIGGPISVGGRPIYSSSEVPISRTNTEAVVKRIRRIDDSPTDPDAEGSDELDDGEVQVVPHSAGHPSSNSSTQPLSNRFQSQVIPSTPRTFQPILASIPTTICPPSPSTSHARPSLNPEVRPSPVQQSRNSPINTCGQLQKNKRWIVPFSVSCRASFTKRTLAYPGYQRRSQCG
ncbi:hypothetical protein O181_105655 [Austropuccinia psidii MF-1]|uniref:Uncharacterized protein n=1 Tax=Austropuccinia psidii MF-1 TaxID=1389203 RepID=A0A9Q3PLU9_9BASI|nr:hypothetical protein [Austropuccinia psidii MF-1]